MVQRERHLRQRRGDHGAVEISMNIAQATIMATILGLETDGMRGGFTPSARNTSSG